MLPKRPLLTTTVYILLALVSQAPLALPCIDATTQGSTADWMFAITMGVLIAINHLISKGFKQQGIG